MNINSLLLDSNHQKNIFNNEKLKHSNKKEIIFDSKIKNHKILH